MIHGLLLGVPFHSTPAPEAPIMPVDESAVPAKPDPLPDTQHAEAVDAVFAQQQQEENAVAGMMTLWSTSMLLVDMAKAHLDRPLEEEEELPKREPKEPAGDAA